MMPGIAVQLPVDNRGFPVKQLLGSGSAPSHLALLALLNPLPGGLGHQFGTIQDS